MSCDRPTGLPTHAPSVVLYDGACPLCRKSVAILQRLDWWRRLRFHDARAVRDLPKAKVPLVPKRLIEEMHVLTPNRRTAFAGFDAFRWIAREVPVLWPLVPLLYFPGIPQLGRRIYLWVAKNRFRLVPCHDGVCALPTRPK